MKVVTVNGLRFSHARQVVRIHRGRRRIGAKKWQTETRNRPRPPRDPVIKPDDQGSPQGTA
ncbi:hypothetical protein ABZ357_12050 [Streptomyces sp. NPDC005917]|uniref:hypothetical protein n=1 Tax=unclassified Streptomyces TaxID=2593676 RepID=UPI0033F2E09B